MTISFLSYVAIVEHTIIMTLLIMQNFAQYFEILYTMLIDCFEQLCSNKDKLVVD
jgi:hypothetical protein